MILIDMAWLPSQSISKLSVGLVEELGANSRKANALIPLPELPQGYMPRCNCQGYLFHSPGIIKGTFFMVLEYR